MAPVPLPTTSIFIVVALAWGWLSDAYRGARAPFIYAGAVLTFVFTILMRQLPLYTNIEGRIAVYWLSNVGFGAGPLILSWINEICSADTEKRALLVAMGNDLAYVVQAVAPNFVWKTTDFPAARKGYMWSIVLQILLVIVTGTIQLLLWRDKRKEARLVAEETEVSRISESPQMEASDEDEKKVIRTEVEPVRLD
jgi:ACS family pantothenate transporter-like MFS transporter